MRIFLACTPRTGNLWIRRVLAHAMDLPQLSAHNPAEIDWDNLPDRCLVAMHWHHTREFSDRLARQGFRTLVTTRHALDVLISILRFAPIEPATARWLDGEGGNEDSLIGVVPESDAFESYCLSRRAAALLGISQEWRADARAVVRYEDFLRAPASVAGDVLEALDARPVRSIQDAIEANAIDALRPLATQHVWLGRAGHWKSLLTPPRATRIGDRYRSCFDDFGYACDPDTHLDAATARRNWQSLSRARRLSC